MPKQELKIELTLEYDKAENDNMPVNIFLYRFLNKINNEHPIKEIKYKGKTKSYRTGIKKLKDIALRKVDSIDDEDLPTPPAWLEEKTVLPPRQRKNNNN